MMTDLTLKIGYSLGLLLDKVTSMQSSNEIRSFSDLYYCVCAELGGHAAVTPSISIKYRYTNLVKKKLKQSWYEVTL
jgi:hypothetical protein